MDLDGNEGRKGREGGEKGEDGGEEGLLIVPDLGSSWSSQDLVKTPWEHLRSLCFCLSRGD